MVVGFQRATKHQIKLRAAFIGPSGSGKTYSALSVAQHLGDRVALIDTERGSASHYANKFAFDTLQLESFHPQRYIEAIEAAGSAGYDVLVIDSLSHAWAGKDGLLEFVDAKAKQMQSGNTFAAWRDATPLHHKLIDAILSTRMHVIVTMRSKMEHVQEKDEKGRTVIRKVGMQPIQRDGLEYEFDIVGDMTQDNDLIISKTRCEALTGQTYHKPGQALADIIKTWLTEGEAEAIAAPKPAAPAPAAPVVTEERQALITDYQAAARAADSRGIEVKRPNKDISNADLKTLTAHLEAAVKDWDKAAEAKRVYQAAEDTKLADAERELAGAEA